MNRLAIKIKEARLKAGLTEKQLAKKCGFAASYIIQIESGKKIVKEQIAEKILKELGEKAELFETDSVKEEEPAKSKVATKPVQPVVYDVKPNEQWADALAGVIKKFPIYDCNTNKVVSYKELPILGKKIEGHNPDKIMFVKASNNDMNALRISMGDVITVSMTKEIQNNSIYLIEVDNKKVIRKIRKENNKLTLSRGIKGEEPLVMNLNKIKLIGKCIKVEFALEK
jgi:transcriptional regulator with XRE-family HTH domain